MADIFYTLGTLAGGFLSPPDDHETEDGPNPGGSDPNGSDLSLHADGDNDGDDHPAGLGEDGGLLVDTLVASAAGWLIKKALRPKSVSWPRVVVAGIGATVLADVLGRALGSVAEDRDRAYDEDPDALLVRLGSGVAMAAGYAALLYPRLPGSPLAKGVIFGAMELAAAPYGGLVRVATDTPGLKFPLKDLAVPMDEHAGPIANLAFGVGLGVLYRPDLSDEEDNEEGDD